MIDNRPGEPWQGDQTARLEWSPEGTPISQQFDDIYFSKHNGVEETHYVFLEGNGLPGRLSAIANHDRQRLCIGETGFGTGLNFLCAWRLRDQLAPKCQLHFISVEKYPLSKPDLIKALTAWPELSSYAEALIDNYPALTSGWHRISFLEQQLELTLYIGDALAGLQDYQGSVDAWFLDGFAPSKNPQMWSNQLFHQIARLSHEQTSFSTFTAAAIVREGLKSAGFEVYKTKGFGNKRHMLTGELTDKTSPHNSRELKAPWFIAPRVSSDNREAVIIGGGLAGTSCAYSLARRGCQVKLFEKHDRLGSEGSGNTQGILFNKLSAEPSLSSNFYTAGYLYSIRQLRQLLPANDTTWQPCGVLQLAYNDKEMARQDRFIQGNPQPDTLVYPVDAGTASRLAGIPLDRGGLFFPGGGWARPSALCEAHTNHPAVELHLHREIHRLEQYKRRWHLFDAQDNLLCTSEIVILANAGAAMKFAQTDQLPLKTIRGQTTNLAASRDTGLRTVLCGNAHVGPRIGNRYYMGSTFNLDCAEPECRLTDHRTNIENISQLAPSFAQALALEQLALAEADGRVGFRCTSRDYLPLVGPMPDREAFLKDYAHLRKDAKYRFKASGSYLPGLYLSVGHGSKGLTSCPLSGELLAAYICQEPFPLSSAIVHAVNPSRFLIRNLKRNKI